jgi:aspartate carbamoyltransferase catalytic subunit
MKHVLEIQPFNRAIIEKLCSRADEMEQMLKNDRQKLNEMFKGRMMFSVFYEPSTRTRMSFSAAAQHLGIQVVSTENAKEFSSAAKGETIEDTVRVLNGYYPDIIVMRHYETGAADKAAAVSTVPIINGGDGLGQHPTQSLLDIYTIKKELGRFDNLKVVIGGDLAHGRTARSLAYLLTKFDNNSMTFVAPEGLEIGDDIKEHLKKHNVRFSETTDLESALADADVVYWTRVQKERFDASKLTGTLIVGKKEMALMKKDSILMHPLPRVDEIATEVDDDSRAAYFRQAGNGMLIRMALIEWVLSNE